jgi:hypothetical protein
MEWLRIGTLLAFFGPAAAVAQEPAVATVVAGEQTNAESQPDGEVVVVEVPDAVGPSEPRSPEPPDPRSGWTAFGVQLGLALAGGSLTALGVAVEPALAGGLITPGIGLVVGGGTLFYALAEEGEWDPALGWSLAALFPGALYGLLAATLVVLASDDVQEDASLALALGASAGAVTAGAAFAAIGTTAGAFWSFLGLWAGTINGMLIGLPFSLAFDTPVPSIVCGLTAGLVQAAVFAFLE